LRWEALHSIYDQGTCLQRQAYEKSAPFKQGQRFRAGIEGRISVLLRGRGMKRCRAEGARALRAVCIIGKLNDGAAAGGPPLLGVAVGNGARGYPPTQAMKRFADSLARQKGIKPPLGYKTSISICSAFLKEHAPKKAEGETTGKLEPKPVSPAQLLYATKIAQGRGLIIPDEAKANSAVMSTWIDSNGGGARLPTSRLVQERLNRRRR
jgi:DNA topoisomerase-3